MLVADCWVPLTVHSDSRGMRTRRAALVAVAGGLAHTAGSLVVMFVVLATGLAVASNFSSLSGTVVGFSFLAVRASKFGSAARKQDRWYGEVSL
jgi:hypothetical protein